MEEEDLTLPGTNTASNIQGSAPETTTRDETVPQQPTTTESTTEDAFVTPPTSPVLQPLATTTGDVLPMPTPEAGTAPKTRPRIIYPAASRQSNRIAGKPAENLALATTNTASYDPKTDFWVPLSYSEAMSRPDLWKEPMEAEMLRMATMKVWRLAERPKGAKVMKSKWLFSVKRALERDEVEKRKARLVGVGCSLIPGVHFIESRAAAVRYESIRATLAMATVRGMYIWQADYTSAYLNAPNQVKILMEQPEGFKATSLQGYQACEGKVTIPNPNGPVYELTATVGGGKTGPGSGVGQEPIRRWRQRTQLVRHTQ
ncbi:hypothetical protein D9613_010720 [Agrocybe pediades]|uniref:Reverse transcriptase Ty1/copia-type domain-containing protein n=1 Tax=Agrocybe pediades TaxID=84607 RepID=A0A8H4QKV6_9AGAR|nr:hypothetical protein D9613_010720 [Agrocybe pediades]